MFSKCLIILSIFITEFMVTCSHNQCPYKFKPHDEKNKTTFFCPGLYNVLENTACCKDKDDCCPPQAQRGWIFYVSLFGITSCLVFIIFLIACMFHPLCPLYNSFKTYYTKDPTSYAYKMGEACSLFEEMPGESDPVFNSMVIAHPFEKSKSSENQQSA